jgi:hypothetical protein
VVLSLAQEQHYLLPLDLLVSSEGKRPLGRLGRRWKDNIKIDGKERCCKGVDWILQALPGVLWRAVINMVMNLRVP